MPFLITPNDRLSLADLAALAKRGAYVVKTPHVGNAYPNNLAVASLGIPLLLVDQTIGARDRNFHPHRLIAGGRAETIADGSVLTTHARVTRAPSRFAERFPLGARTAEAHVRALRDAFPRAAIETESQRARRCQEILLPLLEILTDLAPHEWRRRVDGAGCVRDAVCTRGWRGVAADGIHGFSADGAGWIVPNAWNLLADGVIGSLESGRDTVYELSGPDMIRYYKKLLPEMSRLYDLLRPRFPRRLPETVRMEMAPAAEMRLVTTRRRAAALEALVEAHLRLDAHHHAGGFLRALDGARKEEAIRAHGANRARLVERVRAAAHDCPEIFYRIEEANCLTQYDLLGGEELWVHPWGVEAPLGRLRDALALFARLKAA